jgi:hypothetical protein
MPREVSFDHDLMNFPPVGLHVAAPCEQCHVTRGYRDVGHDCFDSHQKDDIHKSNFGEGCAGTH